MRLEFTELENSILKKKLSQKSEEVQSLKENLQNAKDQLEDVTQKVNNLSINCPSEMLNNLNKSKEIIKPDMYEKEIQTNCNNSLIKCPGAKRQIVN